MAGVTLDQAVLDGINNSLSTIDTLLSSIGPKLQGLFGSVENVGRKAVDATDKTEAGLNKMSEGVDGAFIKTENLGDAFSETTGYLGDFVGKLMRSATASDDAKASIEGVTVATSLAIGVFANLGTVFSGAFGDMEGVGQKTATGTAESMKAISSAVMDINKPLGMVTKGIANLANQTLGIRQLENQLMSMYGKFAGFGAQASGSRLNVTENLEAELAGIVEFNTDVAQATNLSVDEINKYASGLMKLPGAYRETIDAGVLSKGQMDLFEGAVRIARGTTGDWEDSLSALTLQFRSFAKTNKDSLEFLAKTYEVSQSLGYAFGDLKSPIDDIVKQFAVFGNTMDSSVTLVGSLMKAFKDVGLGVEPSTEMIKKLTGAINSLDFAQKSFLSSQTGGPGGLRGALEIEQMLAEGNLTGVYEKMEQALRKQFGGNIVTREEGAQSENAAAQYVKQVKFLTEGPFGGIVQGSGEAAKLLEAFKNGGPGGIDVDTLARDTEDATKNAMTADTQLQQKQLNAAVTMSNDVKRLVTESQILNAMQMRYLGLKEGKGEESLSKILADYQDASSAAAAGNKYSSTLEGGEIARPVNLILENIEKLTNTNEEKPQGLIPRAAHLLIPEAEPHIAPAPGLPPEPRSPRVNLPGEVPNREFSMAPIRFEPLKIEIKVTKEGLVETSSHNLVTATNGNPTAAP
jgi:hypothetical protein